MKKIIAVVVALTLALMMPVLALAEEVAEINWADVEGQVAEAGLEGDFYALNAAAVKLWVPSVLEYQEDGIDEENGVVAMFATADGQYAVVAQYLEGSEGMEMDDFIAGLADQGAQEIERCTLNGLDAVSYIIADTDAQFVAFVTEAGNVLQFIFTPVSDEDFAATAMLITASIQPE